MTAGARIFALIVALAATAGAQGPPPGPEGRGPYRGGPVRGRPTPDMLAGKWWTSPGLANRLGLSDDQTKRLDQVYQQSRLKLIDARAALEKAEAQMDPLLAPDHPQESAVLAQIDRIAEARAELEKANARMLFAFRMVLTPEQWKDLQSRDAGPGGRGMRR